MAITNFIPQIWSSEVLMALRAQLVFAQPGLVNRNYEGEISRAGDTVHIVGVEDVAVKDYAGAVEYDTLADNTRALTISEKRYFAFSVDDVDRRQAAGDFAAAAGVNAAYAMSADIDTFVSTAMVAGAGTKLGGTPIALTGTTPEGAYDDLVIPLRTALAKAAVPAAGRWLVVNSDIYALLLRDSRFIKVNESGTDAGLRNGQVGRIAGFDVFESQTAPANTVVAGHPMAYTFADQLVEMEALRLQTAFGDGIRGLHVYGGAVIRPTALATATYALS